MNVGKNGIYALIITFGNLPCAAINFNLAKCGRFTLMCLFHMCLLVSLFSLTSFCIQSVMTVVSKLHGVIGFMLSSPSFISEGLMICVSFVLLLTNACRNFLYLFSCFQLL